MFKLEKKIQKRMVYNFNSALHGPEMFELGGVPISQVFLNVHAFVTLGTRKQCSQLDVHSSGDFITYSFTLKYDIVPSHRHL